LTRVRIFFSTWRISISLCISSNSFSKRARTDSASSSSCFDESLKLTWAAMVSARRDGLSIPCTLTTSSGGTRLFSFT
jgi:hypothetical protein